MSAVLRVSGPRIDIDECLRWLPQGRVEAVWRAGETGLRGRKIAESGFNLLLAESEDVREGLREAADVFLKMAPQIRELIREGASADVDFALFVGAMEMRSIAVPPSLLAMLPESGVGLVVSAYPVEEGDDGEDAGE